MAEKTLGTVMPADFIFGQLQPDLYAPGSLLSEIDETIRNFDDGHRKAALPNGFAGLFS